MATLSRLIACSMSVALLPVTAAPPPSTSPVLDAARSWATRLMVSTGTPVCVATAATSTPPTAPPSAFASAPGATRPSSTITLSIARASGASVPGALRTHSSALAAVSERRGSACPKGPAFPARERVHLGEGRGVAHRRQPGLEEVGPEGQEIARLLDGVRRNGVPAEGGAVGRAHGLEGQGLLRDAGPGR